MVNVGIIGRGFMAQMHLDALKQIENVNIVAISSRDEEKGRELAGKYNCDFHNSVDSMLARHDIDVIDICTPTHLHEEFAVRAANAGKHILCEKPFTLSIESADRIIQAAQKANVKLMVAQVLRFWPEYVKIKEMYDNGELGNIRTVYANRLAQFPSWSDWFKDPSKSGGALFDLHLHDIDYLRHLLGPVENVYAVGTQSDTGCWDHVITSLTFKSGCKACVEGANIMSDGFPFSMSLRASGSESTIDFRFAAGHNLENMESSQSHLMHYNNGETPTPVKVKVKDPYLEELEYFIECIVNDRQPEVVTPEESKEVISLIAAIKKSLETGEVQKLHE
jgi:UDP-N-acetylglucosamine 3-dehydrogenase